MTLSIVEDRFASKVVKFPSRNWVSRAALCALFLSELCLKGAGLVSQEGTLFDGDRVFEIDISIPESGIASLRTYHWQRWRGSNQPRPKALATVKAEGVVYTNVSVHLKGSAGSFRSVDDNPAMTLNFDKHVKDQLFRGHDKIYLNNSVQDRSYSNEKICRELYNAAGIPTPRSTHAWVTLNGRKLGLYVLIEGFNKRFLKQHFEDVSGNLYDGGFLQDINSDLSVNSGKNKEDKSDLEALFRAAADRDVRKAFQWLPKMLDMERFYSLMALDIMTSNWDGYTMKHNNYRLFHDMKADRFIFIPHGMDQMFERTNGSIYPRFRGLVARSIARLPAARLQVFDRMNALLGNEFKAEKINRRIQEITSAIQTFLREKDSYRAKRQQSSALSLQYQVTRRATFLKNELGAGSRVPKFGPSGSIRVSQWGPRIQFGQPSLDRTQQGNRQLLRVVASGSDQISMGRWASKLTLKQGRYRFSGLMRTLGVKVMAQDVRGGASLSAIGASGTRRLQGTQVWQPFYVDFPVEFPVKEVELGCELRASSGVVLFDLNSLILTKIQ
jgi:spore coat protein H